jgi:hypothetical protein
MNPHQSTQEAIVSIIASFGPIRTGEIYRTLNRSSATLSRAITLLKEHGEIRALPLISSPGAVYHVGRWWVVK